MNQPSLAIAPLLLALFCQDVRAQACLQPDGFEEDDSCLTANLVGGSFCQFGLSVGATTKAVRLHLFAAAQAPVTCTLYDISVETLEATPACFSDSFEPNNCCEVAPPISEGVYDLTLQAGNQDGVIVTAPAGRQIDIFAVGQKPLEAILTIVMP